MPAAAAMFAAIGWSPGAGSDAVDPVPLAAETRCLPFDPIESVKGLNSLVSTLRGGSEFRGADVGPT